MADLLINDRSLAASVSNILTMDGAVGGPARVPTAIAITGAGGVFGAGVQLAGHRMRVAVFCRGYTVANRELLVDELIVWMSGLLELRTDAVPERVGYAALAGRPQVRPHAGVFAHTDFSIDLEFDLVDPTRYDREPLPIALSTSRVSCPVGPVPTAPRLWLYGASPSVVDPHVIVRAHTGEIISDLALVGSLATNDALDIDAARESIDRYVAGVLQTGASAGLTFYDSGYFPLLSPDDGNPDGSVWPTIELSATSGTPTGLLLYSRGY